MQQSKRRSGAPVWTATCVVALAAGAQATVPIQLITDSGLCPYPEGRVNPLASGQVHASFANDGLDGFAAFDAYQGYYDNNEFCIGNTVNKLTGEQHDVLTAAGQVLVKDKVTGMCSPCADCDCHVWIPSPNGDYTKECTGKLQLGEYGTFTMTFPRPGDEKSRGWGPDPIPHVHFHCFHPTNDAFQFWNKFYWELPAGYCEQNGAKSMQLSQPNESNHMALAADDLVGAVALILEDGFAQDNDACFALANANPCDGAVAGADCGANEPVNTYPVGGQQDPTDGLLGTGVLPSTPATGVPVPAPAPTPTTTPPAMTPPVMTGEVYVTDTGATYEFFESKDVTMASHTYTDVAGRSVAGATWQDCADECAATLGCNAASFYGGAGPPGGSNCWLKTMAPAEQLCETTMIPVATGNKVPGGMIFDTSNCEPAETPATPPTPGGETSTEVASSDGTPFMFFGGRDLDSEVMQINELSSANTTDRQACVDMCASTEGCKVASYYAVEDLAAVGGANCHLFSYSEEFSCLPADKFGVAQVGGEGTGLLQNRAGCEMPAGGDTPSTDGTPTDSETPTSTNDDEPTVEESGLSGDGTSSSPAAWAATGLLAIVSACALFAL